VLATAVRDVKTAVEAIKRGAYDYITKPFDVDAIVLLVDRALEKRPSRGRCCACGRSLPFPASGGLAFFCKFHGALGMNGQLLTGDAASTGAR